MIVDIFGLIKNGLINNMKNDDIICEYVYNNPGKTAIQIAQALEMDSKSVQKVLKNEAKESDGYLDRSKSNGEWVYSERIRVIGGW